MPHEEKYGEITTEHGEFTDGEPVILFRARDATLALLLTDYRDHCEVVGSPQDHLDSIDDLRIRVLEWQAEHGCKVPD